MSDSRILVKASGLSWSARWSSWRATTQGRKSQRSARTRTVDHYGDSVRHDRVTARMDAVLVATYQDASDLAENFHQRRHEAHSPKW